MNTKVLILLISLTSCLAQVHALVIKDIVVNYFDEIIELLAAASTTMYSCALTQRALCMVQQGALKTDVATIIQFVIPPVSLGMLSTYLWNDTRIKIAYKKIVSQLKKGHHHNEKNDGMHRDDSVVEPIIPYPKWHYKKDQASL